MPRRAQMESATIGENRGHAEPGSLAARSDRRGWCRLRSQPAGSAARAQTRETLSRSDRPRSMITSRWKGLTSTGVTMKRVVGGRPARTIPSATAGSGDEVRHQHQRDVDTGDRQSGARESLRPRMAISTPSVRQHDAVRQGPDTSTDRRCRARRRRTSDPRMASAAGCRSCSGSRERRETARRRSQAA